MAIYRSSDSVSRYDHQSDMYSLHSRPKSSKDTLNSVSETLNPSRKDTIEISKEKLNEEALSKLGKKETYTVSQNSFMRIGKYLFLAVTLPPYIVIVGIPKWVMLQALPMIFSVLQGAGLKIAEAVTQPFMAVKTKMLQALHFFREATLVFIRPVLHIMFEVKKRFDSIRQKVTDFFDNYRLLARDSFAKIGSFLSLAPFSKIQHSLSNVALLFSQKMRLFFGKLGHLPKTTFHPFHSLRQSWEQKKEEWKASFLSYFKMTQKSANDTTDRIFLYVEEKMGRLKKYFLFLSQFFSRYCSSPVRFFHSFVMEAFGKIGEFIYQKWKGWEISLHRLKEYLEGLQTERWLDVFLSIQFPVWMKTILKRVLSFPVIYQFVHFLIKNSLKGLIQIVDVSNLVMGKIGQKCGDCFAFLKGFTKKISFYFLSAFLFLKHKKKNVSDLLKKGVYYFLLGLIMSGILLKRGGILLREITNDCIFYFSMKKS